MKKLFTTLAIAMFSYCSYAQTNTFPTSGNVGIGTLSPVATLDVNGNGNYASALQIGGGAVNSNTTKLFINNSGYGKNWALSSGANLITEQGFHIYNWTDSPTNPLLTISNDGNTGIGTTSPVVKLDVAGSINMSSGYNLTWGGSYPTGNPTISANGAGIFFYPTGSTSGEMMRINSTGNVGIGTTTPDTKLSVNGTIHSKEVKVDLTAWPDYVFKPTYKLPLLTEVKTYIDQNQHLPEMPSAQEVEKNGVNLGEMVKLQSKKIEELTLYLIEKDVKQQKQEEQINTLLKDVQTLKAQLNNTNKN